MLERAIGGSNIQTYTLAQGAIYPDRRTRAPTGTLHHEDPLARRLCQTVNAEQTRYPQPAPVVRTPAGTSSPAQNPQHSRYSKCILDEAE
jgi:hypothetical protein